MRAQAALGVLIAIVTPSGARATPAPASEPSEAAPEASTTEVARCVDQHEQASKLRLEERWFEAREAMRGCAVDACPIAIRTDCKTWLEELGRTIPTLLVVVERDDGGAEKVTLELDGQSVELPHEPMPIEVLPGSHRLRFSLRGYPPVEQEIVVAKGEQNRVIKVRFARPREPERPAPLVVPPPAPRATRPVPTSTYLLAGGATAAFAASSVLLASTLSSLSEARETCAPECDSDERRKIEARLLTVDVLAGVGVVLGGLAVFTFVTRPTVYEATAPGVAPALRASGKGASLSLEGRF